MVNPTRDGFHHGRRQERIVTALSQLPRVATPPPQQQVIERDALQTALLQLGHGQRSVIVLRYYAQLSEAETAAVLRLSTGAVKSQSFRGLARLREILTAQQAATPTGSTP